MLRAGGFDLPALAVFAGIAALYLCGARRRAERVRRRDRTAAFLIGSGALLAGQLGPVAEWSEALFWVHMVQHLLVIVVAAPLLAWSAPMATVRHALPPQVRHAMALVARRASRASRAAGSPDPLIIATLVHVGAVWLWHTPALYDAAVGNPAVHVVEHATFLGAAVWFWDRVWSSARRAPRTQAIATLCLAGMIVQGAVLGAVLTFASRPLSGVYAGAAGFTALEDQQLAGAIMWVPPGFVYATVAVRRFAGWLRATELGAPTSSAHPDSHRPTVRRNGS